MFLIVYLYIYEYALRCPSATAADPTRCRGRVDADGDDRGADGDVRL